jgi:secreted PhoX family phosphatase
VVAEEAGSTGGLYEIMDPTSLNSTVMVTNRAAGTTTDARLVKRKAVGSLSWEGNAILPDGTMYMGDELRPSRGKAGGGIYKFVPSVPYSGVGIISDPNLSPFTAGTLFGMRLGTSTSGGTPNADYGQGSEIGKGIWVAIDAPTFLDANSNVILDNAQAALGLTGYYRPEDMERDPIAAARGEVRVCWTNTGRMSNGGGSVEEEAANYGEVLCMVDQADETAVGGGIPQVSRFWVGDSQANHFDNLAFQPTTGRLIVLEDGGVDVVRADGTTELRGNDIWYCLPDGADRDTLSDGCIRILSLRDTDSEPTGFIFTGNGRSAYVNLQHRNTGRGALLRIDGFGPQ